jgi:hypothetical protein
MYLWTFGLVLLRQEADEREGQGVQEVRAAMTDTVEERLRDMIREEWLEIRYEIDDDEYDCGKTDSEELTEWDYE